jgi:hypothetical protein
MSRFIDPTTDFGFKKLFGEKSNKDLTLSFVNDVLELDAPLRDLSFSNIERLPETAEERKGIYDLICEDAEDNYYLVEMQKHRITFIKDRMLYYSTFPIVAQAKKGKSSYYSYQPPEALYISEAMDVAYGKRKEEEVTNWDFELKAIYCIAVLGYKLNGSTRAVNRNSLRNDEPPHELYCDKLKFVTVELPLFDESKPEYSLDRHLNQWLFFLKYAAVLDYVPKTFKNDPIFRKAFRVAELARLTPKERREYELNVKYMRDTYAVLKTSRNEGRIEGRIEKGQDTLHMLFSQKLGQLPPDIAEEIRALNEDQIDVLLAHFLEINDWETLRRYLLSFDHKSNTST